MHRENDHISHVKPIALHLFCARKIVRSVHGIECSTRARAPTQKYILKHNKWWEAQERRIAWLVQWTVRVCTSVRTCCKQQGLSSSSRCRRRRHSNDQFSKHRSGLILLRVCLAYICDLFVHFAVFSLVVGSTTNISCSTECISHSHGSGRREMRFLI